jgi:type IV pilus assembly protein PilA
MRRLKSKKNPTQLSRSQAGFSLIELLVVVAVILIIAAIAIPNYLASKMRANEASAAQNVRSITTSELIYSTTYSIGFSNTLVQLEESPTVTDQNHAGLIDEVLASGTKSGYAYTYTPLTFDTLGNPSTYSITAAPLVPGNTGQKYFYADQTSVIRYNLTAPAGPNDQPL